MCLGWDAYSHSELSSSITSVKIRFYSRKKFSALEVFFLFRVSPLLTHDSAPNAGFNNTKDVIVLYVSSFFFSIRFESG